MRRAQEAEEKGSATIKKPEDIDDPADLRKKWARFLKEKKIAINNKDEDIFGTVYSFYGYVITKYTVNEKIFRDFLKWLSSGDYEKKDDGSSKMKNEAATPTEDRKLQENDDIDKFFRTFAENKGNLTNNTLKISMKAFMYNYKVSLTFYLTLKKILS